MGLSDRDYIGERYRARGGAKALPVWREAKGRLEFEQEPPSGNHVRNAPVRFLRSPQRANSMAVVALGIATVLYAIIAKPFGDLVDLRKVPETGEFRVAPDHASAPTGHLSFVAADEDLKIYLFDMDDALGLVGYIRAGETAQFQVPVGDWRLAAASDQNSSIGDIRSANHARPLGAIKIEEGHSLTISPVKH